MKLDLTEDVVQTPGDLQKVLERAREMFIVERDISFHEEALKKLEERHVQISTVELPALMKAEGYAGGVPLTNGDKLELKQSFRASVPAESTIEKAKDDAERNELLARRVEGITWLRENGGTPLIKEEMKLEFGQGQAPFIKAIRHAIKVLCKTPKFKKAAEGLEVSGKQSIHQGSLGKYLREKIEAGVKVPIKTFAIFDGQEAIITKPKGQKKGK